METGATMFQCFCYIRSAQAIQSRDKDDLSKSTTPAWTAALEDGVEAASLVQNRSPPLRASPSRRAMPITPADRMGACVDYLPIRAAFPVIQPGRHPRFHFRGLLRLHSRYGPPGCSTAQGGLCYEASMRSVTQPNRSSATRPIDNYLGGTFLHW